MQAVWASAVMVLPKKRPQQFRLVAEYWPVNARVEQIPAVMPNEEASMAKLNVARGQGVYGSLDMLQGYWQLLLAPEAHESFAISTPDVFYSPPMCPKASSTRSRFFRPS